MTQLVLLDQDAVGLKKDRFQTPAWAVEAIMPMLPKEWQYWEPCAGKGNIVRAMKEAGYLCCGSDVEGLAEYCPHYEPIDFLRHEPKGHDAIITNPPYSNYGEFIRRCFELGKPFALLIPDSFADSTKRMEIIREYGGVDVVYLPERVAFETPTGRTGKDSSPNFLTVWVCKGFDVSLLAPEREPSKCVYLPPRGTERKRTEKHG